MGLEGLRERGEVRGLRPEASESVEIARAERNFQHHNPLPLFMTQDKTPRLPTYLGNQGRSRWNIDTILGTMLSTVSGIVWLTLMLTKSYVYLTPLVGLTFLIIAVITTLSLIRG